MQATDFTLKYRAIFFNFARHVLERL